jgi:hypothetical protein
LTLGQQRRRIVGAPGASGVQPPSSMTGKRSLDAQGDNGMDCADLEQERLDEHPQEPRGRNTDDSAGGAVHGAATDDRLHYPPRRGARCQPDDYVTDGRPFVRRENYRRMMSVMQRHLLCCVAAAAIIAIGCSRRPSASEQAALEELASIKAIEAQEQKHLALFEDFDVNVYSKQNWNALMKSHASDIVVHWPDGRTTRGVENHLVDLRQQFVFAPDAAIEEHPIKIAKGNWTTVVAVMTGTFTQPMPIPDAKPIAATNQRFRFELTTIARWDGGVMKEKWLMWDNRTFMRQVGLAR